jgi:hypothetical protein
VALTLCVKYTNALESKVKFFVKPMKPKKKPPLIFKAWALLDGTTLVEVSVDKSNLAEAVGKEKIVKVTVHA